MVLLVSAYLLIFVPRIGLENFRYYSYDSSLFQPPAPSSSSSSNHKRTAQQATAVVAAAEKNGTNVTIIAIEQAQTVQLSPPNQTSGRKVVAATTTTPVDNPPGGEPANIEIETTPPSAPPKMTTWSNQTNNVTRANIPQINNNTDNTNNNITRLPRRHVALLGPHDRFNFGDLLFEKVVSKLLQERAGYLPNELHAVGLVNVNMSTYGGHEHVIRIPDAIALSQQAPKAFDIIYLGGEALGCNHACGVRMLPSAKQKNQAKQFVVPTNNCAYLFPKQWLVRNPNKRKQFGKFWKQWLMRHNITTVNNNNKDDANSAAAATKHGNNVAIVNSPGVVGSLNRTKFPCMDALDQADYMSFRDLNTTEPHPYFPKAELRPDSAVLTQSLFQKEIADAVQRYLVPLGLLDRPYLAVQIKSSFSIPTKEIAAVLNDIQIHTNYTVVFFRAGSTWGHDSLEFYRNITQQFLLANQNTVNANTSTTIFTTEHVWAVVALIQNAAAVLSTSLHVRIMAFVHQRPRATWCSREGAKHDHFVQLWEAADHKDSCIFVGKGKVKSQTRSALQASLVSSTTTNHTQVAVQKAIDSYLEGFDIWSKLLNRP